ncbi:MAG: DNA repair protein RadA [Proteobacteria bacterium]|nr:DNA repair protein RadA [Pseudomonadota bacterium]
MAKNAERFVCQSCGALYRKWQGKCDSCNEWNSIVEEVPLTSVPKGLGGTKGRVIELVGLKGEAQAPSRWISGITEFDRACGGGLVPGSAVLIGGDPGIGKSTILLQAVASLATAGVSALYISGEEAVDQIRMRAERLGLSEAPLQLATETSVRDILTTLEQQRPDVVVIDSIQTMYVESLESAPGTVSQVRASAQELIRLAKTRGFSVILVGHVTKEGTIAGPKVLEHMVDTVLYFEGERGHHFRILRAVKNRFGPADEIGVFEMTDAGLAEVPNPSALFLSERDEDGGESVSGAAVFAGVEGTRPVLVEIQALVAPSAFSTPRRAVVGWDSARLHMVLAVLETRCGVSLAGRDVFLNVAGGLRIGEPAADLAVAAALLSSLGDRPVESGTVVFGEIGLGGEVRAVSQTDTRLKEAAKLGFHRAILPRARGRGRGSGESGIARQEIGRLHELVEVFEDGDS